jgi:hypothetical protein
LAKQAEYVKEMTTIDSKLAFGAGRRRINLTIEVRIYDSSGKLKATMSALCKAGSDLETAKKIFMTIQFH